MISCWTHMTIECMYVSERVRGGRLSSSLYCRQPQGCICVQQQQGSCVDDLVSLASLVMSMSV